MVAVGVSSWKMAVLAAGVVGIAWAGGCVGFGGPGGRAGLSRPIVEFPTQSSLATIESQPASMPSITTGEIPAAGWTLDAHEVALDPGEPFTPHTPWEIAFATESTRDRAEVHLTRAMSCVAREAGRFVLETRAMPPDLLQQFLIAACGAVVPRVGLYWLSGEPPASTSDDQVLAQWRAQIKGDMLVHLPADSTDAGFWYGRARGRAVAVMTYVANHVRWKTLGVVPDAQGGVTLEGELGEASEYIVGYANQGRFNVEACTIDPSVARPRFRATCHMAKDDSIAWVQLLSAPPKRVLAAPFAQVLLRRTVDQPLSFDMRPYADPRPVKDAADFSNAIVTALNVVRAQAGFRPVQLSIAESARATHLAAHFFADSFADGGGEKSDRIALGLLAGWQLEGLIRDGRFSASLSPHTRDAGQWLNAALSSPWAARR